MYVWSYVVMCTFSSMLKLERCTCNNQNIFLCLFCYQQLHITDWIFTRNLNISAIGSCLRSRLVARRLVCFIQISMSKLMNPESQTSKSEALTVSFSAAAVWIRHADGDAVWRHQRQFSPSGNTYRNGEVQCRLCRVFSCQRFLYICLVLGN